MICQWSWTEWFNNLPMVRITITDATSASLQVQCHSCFIVTHSYPNSPFFLLVQKSASEPFLLHCNPQSPQKSFALLEKSASPTVLCFGGEIQFSLPWQQLQIKVTESVNTLNIGHENINSKHYWYSKTEKGLECLQTLYK